ncbi:IgA-specific serine endopeptidase autotransporter [Amphibalanus amphitrite]|uniref:IgA-specific serine endopeptidase autotransporter n=1 Tax=Amphibalanus amphitrite TaxID=1232801 RepID=A0A6A4XH80_AMPAM|nr:IgA-specific serine endopeptidase autotransporter [Amphibalanus amphitrite]
MSGKQSGKQTKHRMQLLAGDCSEARRRAALSKLQAEQVQRAAAAKAELARRQAEAQAEQARQQAEQSRRQAEQAEAQAALQAQAAMDEAEYRQLELELLEQEERGSQHPRSSAAPSVARLPVVATEPPAPVDVSRQTDESVTRTRQWLAQSQLHVPPVDTAPVGTLPPPAVRLQHPSRDDTRAVPHLPRITLEKFGGSAIEWPRWIALFKALVHDRADLTDVERLTYLQTHLTGPARESVRGMLCDASLYSTALGELEREFGDPSRVIHATMQETPHSAAGERWRSVSADRAVS